MSKKSFLFFFLIAVTTVFSQAQVPVQKDTAHNVLFLQDSLLADTAQVKAIDTLTPNILKIRDSLTNALWLDSLNRGYGFEVFSLQKVIAQANNPQEKVSYQHGQLLPKGDVWVLGIIGFLLVLFAILKNAFGKQLSSVVQSFYSNRALANLNKEDNLVTSWSFLLLFIQFGFTIGMFFYLAAQYQNLPAANQGGFSFFVTVSVGVIFLYLLKIICLRFIGFVFDVQRPLHQYISILYLSYFNTSLLFIPIIIAFALSAKKYGASYIVLGISALLLIFVFQFIRAAINILSQYRFPKLYLFLYFCTLEICPILILIKAVGI
ncbi:DUF4271 domain-containing protein [Pedobacter chitinilyticus]|uniref:DUF4271 domain-containing protein n=1 Tax=Pedobacter chitinilyticus TaxID=2233776 RepID=A0A3S3PY86_9SPHI|nr:DUF4271 domain-containing protein [Pedobacter chitinilyticus]RWU05691.1 DUF4271 domain-containing protein [Pedobacter chitinilyticus]